MKQYRVASIDKQATYQVLTVEPMNNSDLIHFEAGQYATFGFYSNGRPTPMRPFSITASPGTGQLQFAMRPYGKFTSKVRRLKPGDKINVQGPFGNFVVDHELDERIVMLAAGIGITPMLSIIRDATRRNLSLPITLIYSNHDEEIPFKAELLDLMNTNPNFDVVFAVSNGKNDQEERIFGGRLSENLIQALVGAEAGTSTYFICGPSGYIKKANKILRSLGVQKETVLTESFSQRRALGLRFPTFGIQTKTLTAAFASIAVIAGTVGIIDLWHNTPSASAANTIESLLEDESDNSQSSTSSTSSGSSDTSGTYYSDPYSTSQTPSASSNSSGNSQTYISPSSGVS